MKEPLYTKEDRVLFLFNGTGEPMEGVIEVVDAAGTFFDRTEPSYDIRVPEKNCVCKHVLESHIIYADEALLRGVLVYQEDTGSYGVKYSEGYTAVLDNPVFTEIRLAGMPEWILVSLIIKEIPEHIKEEWIGRAVEIRNRTL